MAARIQFRRGTAQQWTTSNPTLAEGELGLETDTGKFKIGNGSSRWVSLNYGGLPGPSGPSGVQGPVNRYVETLLNFDTSTYYLTMSSGIGNVSIKNNTALTYVANSGILTAPLIKISNTQNSTSTVSGALTVAGGVGISKDTHIGGQGFIDDDLTVSGQLYLNYNNGDPGPAMLPGVSGSLLPGIFDIGATGGEFRSLYLSNNITAGGNIKSTGNIYSGGDTQVDGVLYINWQNAEEGPGILPGVNGKLLPNVYDIGSPEGTFKDLYLGGNANIGGNLTIGGLFTNPSDSRLKTNVKTIENALDKTRQLRGVTFDKDGKNNIGVIAQEVQKILPQVVIEGDDENKTLSVAYGNIVGLLIEAVKELTAELDSVKSILKSAGLN
jgi:hypothetical protein